MGPSKKKEILKKLDGIDQYGRRQNLEFQGVPITDGEDMVEVVVKIGKVLDVELDKKDVSTVHRLPRKFPANGKAATEPPPIIARYINRDLRNKIYSKRAAAKHIAVEDFPVTGMRKLFVNENLTQSRKRLLWLTKQSAKALDYSFVWTNNGKIYARKNEDETRTVIIQCESDLRNL